MWAYIVDAQFVFPQIWKSTAVISQVLFFLSFLYILWRFLGVLSFPLSCVEAYKYLKELFLLSRFTLIGRSCPFPVWQYYNQCSWLRALEIGIFLWDPESGAINLAEVFFDFYPALTATQAHIQLTREISCQQGDQNPGGTISSLICHQPSKSLLITLSISKEALLSPF